MKPKRRAKNGNKPIIGFFLLNVIFLFLITLHSTGFSQETGIDKHKQTVAPKQSVTVEFSDVDIIQNEIVGLIILPKDRWKNWVARCIYLIVINSLIFVVIFWVPKTDKYSVLASYFLSGASFMLSFWIMMLSHLLFRLKPPAGIGMFGAGAISLVVSYIVLVKIKSVDVVDGTQTTVTADTEDKRFTTIQGHASELPEDDFIK